jgi:hypothetical protein
MNDWIDKALRRREAERSERVPVSPREFQEEQERIALRKELRSLELHLMLHIHSLLGDKRYQAYCRYQEMMKQAGNVTREEVAAAKAVDTDPDARDLISQIVSLRQQLQHHHQASN